MNKKADLIGEAIIFIVVWIASSFIWAIWLDGLSIPLAGLGSAFVFRLAISVTDLHGHVHH